MTNAITDRAPDHYRPGWFRRLCWFTTGADSSILCTPAMPEFERMRFASIGATMLIITGLGVLSGAMAFYQIFYPGENEFEFIGTPWRLASSCVFALLWTLALYNMQRFLIFGSHRDSTKPGLGLSDFLNMLPGLIFSCVIGLTVATPLQIFVLDTEIDTQRLIERQDKLEAAMASVEHRFPRPVRERGSAVDTPDENLHKTDATSGSIACGTGSDLDDADISASLKHIQLCLRHVNSRITSLDHDKAGGAATGNGVKLTPAQATTLLQDLIRQREILEVIQIVTQEPGMLHRAALAYEIDPLFSWVLLLAVIFVQAAPVLVCSMSVRGPYDDLVDIDGRERLAEEGIEPGMVYLFPTDRGAFAVDRYHQAKLVEENTRRTLTEQRKQLRQERLAEFKRRFDLLG